MSETVAAPEAPEAEEVKLSVQVRFTGSTSVHAEFVKRAIAASGLSQASFGEQALLNEAAEILGEDAPELEKRSASEFSFGEKGSRLPEAKALDLSTKEYKRRVKELEHVAKVLNIPLEQMVTPENILKVPAAPPAKPRKKAAAETPAA